MSKVLPDVITAQPWDKEHQKFLRRRKFYLNVIGSSKGYQVIYISKSQHTVSFHRCKTLERAIYTTIGCIDSWE